MIISLHNDISNILKSCFDKLTEEEDVRINDDFIRTYPHYGYTQAWSIITTITTINPTAEDIEFVIGFRRSFPYSIPDIYYFDTKYDYLPHIDSQTRKLCLFNEDVVHNVHDPYALIKIAINKAKDLIIKGSQLLNIRHFKDEIRDYWRIPYGKEKHITHAYIHTIDINTETKYVKLCTSSYIRNIGLEACIIEPDKNGKYPEYIEYIKSNDKRNFIERDILFLSSVEIPDTPPYNITTDIFLRWIKNDNDKKAFKRYINKPSNTHTIIFKLSDTLLAGINYNRINANRNGYRPGSLTNYYIISNIEKHKPIERFFAAEYSATRIAMRTKGEEQKHYKITIAGLGSVGSYLCGLLNSLNSPDFTLIDPDIMFIDNLGRHLLGFNYLNTYKSDAMQMYIKSINPNQITHSFHEKVEDYIINNISTINDNDGLFLCTGNTMSELFIYQKINDQQISIPVFILWLEPYAIAGHMIYIGSQSDQILKDLLYTPTGIYRYNLIEDEEYDSKSFTKKDAGCCGNYTLYSSNDVVLFLSSMYPIICGLLNKKETSTLCYRWIGDTNIAHRNNIKLKNDIKSYEVEEIKI